MWINIPQIVSQRLRSEDFGGERPVYVERLGDGTGFAYNAENPSGVVYLSRRAFETYAGLLGSSGQAPRVDPNSATIFAAIFGDLVRHGVAVDINQPFSPRAKECSEDFLRVVPYLKRLQPRLQLLLHSKIGEGVRAKIDGAALHESRDQAATQSLFEFCVENGFGALQIKFCRTICGRSPCR